MKKLTIEKKSLIKMGKDLKFKNLGMNFVRDSVKHKYSYHFSWLGRPIIQYPQEIIAIQEIIWEVKPDLIIETKIFYTGREVH